MGRESSIPVRVGHFYSCCAESAFCCKENALEYVAPYDKILIAIEIGRAEIRAFEDCASKSLPERPPQCPARGFHAAVS